MSRKRRERQRRRERAARKERKEREKCLHYELRPTVTGAGALTQLPGSGSSCDCDPPFSGCDGADGQPQSPTSDSGPSTTSIIKDALTLIGGVGAVAYAAGFLILAIHLNDFGISAVGLTNVRYISVGLCYLILLSATAVPVILVRLVKSWNIFGWTSSLLPWLTVIFWVFFPLLVALVASFGPQSDGTAVKKRASEIFGVLLENSGMYLLWILCVAGISLSLAEVVIKYNSPHRRGPDRAWLASLAAFLVFAAAWPYVYGPFGLINSGLGGGLPVKVEFVTNPKSKDVWANLLRKRGTTDSTDVWFIIDETEKTYFIAKSKEPTARDAYRAIQVNKELVKAVLWFDGRDGRKAPKPTTGSK
jgi:hypothetical protein